MKRGRVKTAAAWPTGMGDNAAAAPVTFMGGAAQLRQHTMGLHPERSNTGQAAKVFLTQHPPQGKANQQRK